MDGVVQRLSCHYLLPGGIATAAVRAQLDNTAKQAVEQAWGDPLDAALGDDPSVYMLRRVQASYRLSPKALNDSRLAHSWGASLAMAVAKTIASDTGDGSNLVRFEDQADYVAHFAADLADGAAWGRWFYGAFAALRSRTTADALATVLLSGRERLPAVLARLHRLGALDKVLAALDEPVSQALCALGTGEPGPIDPQAARLLLVAATELAAALDLWDGRPDTALLERYLRTHPRPVRWGDPADLATGAWDAFCWLAETACHTAQPAAVTSERLDPVLARLDWLDTDMLRQRLLRSWAGPDTSEPDLPTRPRGRAPTPRQQQLIHTLLGLIRSGAVRLDPAESATAANALRLQAVLADQAPHWAADILPPKIIQHLLQALGWLRASPRPAETLQRLREGRPAGNLPARSPHPPAGHAPAQPAAETRPAAADGPGDTPPPVRAADFPAIRAVAAGPSGALDAGTDDRWSAETLHRPRDDAPVRGLRGLTPSLVHGTVSAQPAAQPRPAVADEPVSAQPLDPETADFIVGLGAVGIDLLEALNTAMVAGQGGYCIQSPCAGVLLLLRAIADVRLRSLAARVGYPPSAPWPDAALPLALGLRWAGATESARGRVGTSVAMLAAVDDPPTREVVGRAWSAATPDDDERFQLAWLTVLTGHRLLEGGGLHLFAFPGARETMTVIASSDPCMLWPVGRVGLTGPGELSRVVAGWLAAWQELTGRRPDWIVCDDSLVGTLRAGLPDERVTGITLRDAPPGPGTAADAHRAGRRALVATRRCLSRGRLGLPAADLTVELTAATLLRLWARWLPGFAEASVPYLLEQFVRRPGRIRHEPGRLLVELDRRPLDIVLELAGYTSPLTGPGLDVRPVTFRLRDP
jgi:hypothetical protein